jgi:hypothetical protein
MLTHSTCSSFISRTSYAFGGGAIRPRAAACICTFIVRSHGCESDAIIFRMVTTNSGKETRMRYISCRRYARQNKCIASSGANDLPSREELEAALASKNKVIESKNETIAIKDAVILTLQKEIAVLRAGNTSHKRKRVYEDWIKLAEGPYIEVYQPEASQRDMIDDSELEQPGVPKPSCLRSSKLTLSGSFILPMRYPRRAPPGHLVLASEDVLIRTR